MQHCSTCDQQMTCTAGSAPCSKQHNPVQLLNSSKQPSSSFSQDSSNSQLMSMQLLQLALQRQQPTLLLLKVMLPAPAQAAAVGSQH
jgi:hypothetical protein